MNQKTQEKGPPMTFERRRTLTMTWDGLGEDDDDDQFFESFERLSSAVSLDLASSGSDDDEEYDDNRISFASAMSSATAIEDLQGFKPVQASSSLFEDYNMWTSEPGSIKERRRRLFQDMGLSSNKNLISVTSTKLSKIASKKVVPESGLSTLNNSVSPKKSNDQNPTSEELKQETSPSMEIVHVRSRSDGDIDTFSANTRRRKEELVGSISKQRLTRTSSTLTPQSGIYQYANTVRVSPKRVRNTSLMNNGRTSELPNGQFGAFFLIKDLDTGKEFIVKEFNDDGMWNRLSDVQTGKQLTMEEFEKSVGYSPVVKELMRRENVSRNLENERKVGTNSYLSKSFRNSKRRGVALLKNIKGVANSISGSVVDKEKEQQQHINSTEDQQRNKNLTSKWIKARQQGKSIKEFTALHLCQEVQAHEGSIWTIRFSPDARYLASAGEDRVVHVWEVQECEVMSPTPNNDLSFAGMTASQEASAKLSSDQPSLEDVSPLPSERRKERPPLAGLSPMPSERKKKGKVSNKKKGNSIPHYVYVPETVFSLSEKPVCSFTGHLDDVLDLSWSKTQLLLSASMDKTVRLWDMETKSCLKLFAHNDYVTSIQFNPVDDNYFISGSLDAKVRLWSIPDRQLIDYTDMHEMVTAARYTPDGQGALIGSHKGSYRLYSTADCCLEQKDQIEIRHRKKSHAKKVTGFEFAPGNPSEVLVTSADSRIRIIDGSDIIHKFRGFRNTSSQISASFSANGKYVVSASEDSQVYIWKRQELRNSGTGKSKGLITTYSHEHFHCKDVSVAIPWPGSIKNEPPIVEVHSKRHSKRFIPNPTFTTGSPAREGNPVGTSSRRTLPPLPKKNSDQEDLTQGSHHTSSEDGINSKRQLPPLQKRDTILDRATSCHDEEHHQASHTDFENGTNSKRHLPPRPKKNRASERTTSCQDEDLAQNCRMNGVSERAIHFQDEDLTQTGHMDSQARTSSKRQLPLLPKKNDVSERATSCNDEELPEVCRTNSEEGTSSKRQLPPTLSKKNITLDRAMSCQDEDPACVARTDSEIGIGESFTSGSSSIRYDGSPSISTSATSASQSWSSSWSILDGNSQGAHTVQATAWGMVIVTAGLGGEIRAYQNLGLPVKVGRQTNLFRDLT